MNDQVDKIVEGILIYLKARKAEQLLPQVIDKLQAKVKISQETARIISAVSMTLEEQTSIKEYLKKTFGKEFNAEVFVDPSIIGGFILHVGDEVIDKSIKGKLKKLSEDLED